MMRRRLAPAKVNLFLHVGPAGEGGYHPLSSLMVFADVGDVVGLAPADATSFQLEGAFACALAGEPLERNLAVRAVRAVLERAGVAQVPFRLVLDKALPVASGLGGGSSDAGAALRLARDLFAPQVSDAELEAVALSLGSDGPACLHAQTVLAQGRGERLSRAPALPPLPAVLVNPGVACATGAVYRAYDLEPRSGGEALPDLPQGFARVSAVIDVLRGTRNDLEGPALQVAPAIAAVLAALRQAPETGLARLSGSGATCFALCPDEGAAHALAHRLSRGQPSWWVRACRLGPGGHEAVIGETQAGCAA